MGGFVHHFRHNYVKKLYVTLVNPPATFVTFYVSLIHVEKKKEEQKKTANIFLMFILQNFVR